MAEWLWRWPAKPLGSARVGSNPAVVVCYCALSCKVKQVFEMRGRVMRGGFSSHRTRSKIDTVIREGVVFEKKDITSRHEYSIHVEHIDQPDSANHAFPDTTHLSTSGMAPLM